MAKKPIAPAPKPKATRPAPAPTPMRLFLVRCTFVGEVKKQRVEGSFRFVVEDVDAAGVRSKLGTAVRKLRRAGELPARCDVYVEFVLELAGLRGGVVTDFERWEHNPRRFQHGCIAFSDTCALHESGQVEAAFRFGAPPPPVAANTPSVPRAG